MNNPAIKRLIDQYKKHLREQGLSEELYKWKLLAQYRGRPDPAAIDFLEELKSVKFSNLIYGPGLGVMQQLARERPAGYRACFELLFDESRPLVERVKNFSEETLNIFRAIEPNENLSHHQDERTIATLLTYHNPDKYTFYKNSFYKKYCDLLGLKQEKKNEKYVHYLSLVEDFIKDYIQLDQELIDLVRERLPEGVFLDKNYKLLGQDILYGTLDLQVGMGRHYWRIGTRDENKQSYWEYMKTQEVICIGWPKLGDLREKDIQSKNDIRELMRQTGYHKQDQRKLTTKAGEVFNFFNQVNIGDIIVAQDGDTVLGIGLVKDEYCYEENNGFPHQLPVSWELFNPDLKSRKGRHTSVYNLSNIETIKLVEQALKNSTSSQKDSFNHPMNTPLNQILYGPPGTGKTYHTINKAIEIIQPDFDLTQDRALIKAEFDRLVEAKRIAFVTFHQSMSYEDFIEGIKPQEEEQAISYAVEDGIFKSICEEAQKVRKPLINIEGEETDNIHQPYVLIIDEINRGNVSEIFGELITLIETDKRMGQKEALCVMLPYSQDSFGVPDNLFLIGTMNTANRSVEALDTALRRRFSFTEIPPQSDLIREKFFLQVEQGILNLQNESIDLAKVLETINQRIEILLDRDHLIGHSYFMSVHDEDSLKQTFAKSILPLLQEYFYGDYGKIALVLGEGFCQGKAANIQLLAKVKNYDTDFLSDKIIYKIPDIMGPAFDITQAIKILLYGDTEKE